MYLLLEGYTATAGVLLMSKGNRVILYNPNKRERLLKDVVSQYTDLLSGKMVHIRNMELLAFIQDGYEF
jgi:hypothetical protein